MPLRLEVKKKFSCVSDRVKCVDVHPTEPWVLASLFNGHVCLWNYTTQVCVWWGVGGGGEHVNREGSLALCLICYKTFNASFMIHSTFTTIPLRSHISPNPQALIKDIEIGELPVRVAKFIARKQWVICGSDDMMLRVYNYNTSGIRWDGVVRSEGGREAGRKEERKEGNETGGLLLLLLLCCWGGVCVILNGWFVWMFSDVSCYRQSEGMGGASGLHPPHRCAPYPPLCHLLL